MVWFHWHETSRISKSVETDGVGGCRRGGGGGGGGGEGFGGSGV
jgi:hypothetical protein